MILVAVALMTAAPQAPAQKQEGRAWVTHFGSFEGRQGVVGCRGNKLGPGDCAANKLPYGTRIRIASGWLQGPHGKVWYRGRTLTVRDTGARSNDQIARRRKASLWVDTWVTDRRLKLVTGVLSWRRIH